MLRALAFPPRTARLIVLVTLAVLLGMLNRASAVAAAPLGATSPILVAAASYSVLAHTTVTCTGSTTTNGAVGVSTGTSITGFPSPCTAGGGTHSNDASAIAAQADNLIAFGTLDQGCVITYTGVQDLTLVSPLGPGVYCADAFILTGNLALSGSGVWIFKSAATLKTSSGSSVTGGDPCNVWWRLGSSGVIGTGTRLIGNILALTSISLATGARLNGRALAQTGGVTLDANTITGPTCAAATATPTITPGGPTLTPTITPGGLTLTPTITPGGPTLTPTHVPTSAPTATNTPVERESTNTPVPGAPTATNTPSITPGGPTLTPTITPGGPTLTPTSRPPVILPKTGGDVTDINMLSGIPLNLLFVVLALVCFALVGYTGLRWRGRRASKH